MGNVALPESLYDGKNSHQHGALRVPGYWMRIRIEYLLEQPEGSVGLRRAMHTCILSEVVNNAYSGPQDGHRADKVFGWFPRELMQKVHDRLVASKATLRGDEKHFADIGWWGRLDREKAAFQLESNLERMNRAQLSTCLALGIELHVLLDICMRRRYNGYESAVSRCATSEFPALVEVRDRLSRLLEQPVAA